MIKLKTNIESPDDFYLLVAFPLSFLIMGLGIGSVIGSVTTFLAVLAGPYLLDIGLDILVAIFKLLLS